MKTFSNIAINTAKIIAFFVLILISITHLQAQTAKIKELRNLDQNTLDQLYLEATPGPMPDGRSRGAALFFPTAPLLNNSARVLSSLLWQGKIFDTNKRVLLNRVIGFRAVKAEIFYGPSLLDGKESIIIEYRHTSLVAKSIRDEIRMVSPGVYLGRAYMRAPGKEVMLVNFVLDFNIPAKKPFWTPAKR